MTISVWISGCIIKSNYLWFIQNILLLLLLLFYAIHLTECYTGIRHAAIVLRMILKMSRLARQTQLAETFSGTLSVQMQHACMVVGALTFLGMHLKTFLNCTWYNKLCMNVANKLESLWKHMWKDKCTNKWQNRDNIQLWICTIFNHVFNSDSVAFTVRAAANLFVSKRVQCAAKIVGKLKNGKFSLSFTYSDFINWMIDTLFFFVFVNNHFA